MRGIEGEIGYRRCTKSDTNPERRVKALDQSVIDYCGNGHLVDAAVFTVVAGQYIGIVIYG
jgi:ligand-binding sensor protein